MPHVRCIRNVKLEVVLPNGSKRVRKFAYGRWYETDVIEEVDDKYINIVLSNGQRIDGVQKRLFENQGTPTKRVDMVAIPQEKVEEVPRVEELKKTDESGNSVKNLINLGLITGRTKDTEDAGES
jgi:hypothetical protein